tara:strand:- start:505 stop:1092 length:588 start_codon:yes stop_codon:yes gene_type:complete
MNPFNLLKNVGIGKSLMSLAATTPQLQAISFGAQIVGGLAGAFSSKNFANRQLPNINRAISGIAGQKEQVSDIAQIERGISAQVRKEDREFASEDIGFKKESLTRNLATNLNKQGFSTSLAPTETAELGMDALNLSADKMVTGIDRQYGARLASIDESEANKLAQIDKSLQELQLQKAKLQQNTGILGFVGNALG